MLDNTTTVLIKCLFFTRRFHEFTSLFAISKILTGILLTNSFVILKNIYWTMLQFWLRPETLFSTFHVPSTSFYLEENRDVFLSQCIITIIFIIIFAMEDAFLNRSPPIMVCGCKFTFGHAQMSLRWLQRCILVVFHKISVCSQWRTDFLTGHNHF